MTDGLDHVRRLRAFTMIVLGVLMVAEAAAQQRTSTTPATVKEVMATIGPSSDVIFMAASEPPQNEQQWAAVRKNAAMLAESARLLTTGERVRDRTTWITMSRELVTKAESALKAAGRRNAEVLAETGDELYATCETCHARYMKP